MGLLGGTYALRDALVAASFAFSLSSGFFFGFQGTEGSLSLSACTFSLAAPIVFLVLPAVFAYLRPTRFLHAYFALVIAQALAFAATAASGSAASGLSAFFLAGASDLGVVCAGYILSFSSAGHIKRNVCIGVCLAALVIPAFHALTPLDDASMQRILLALFFVCATAFAAIADGDEGRFPPAKDVWGAPREAWGRFCRGNGESRPLFLAVLAFCALFFFCFGLMAAYAAARGMEVAGSDGVMLFVAVLSGAFLVLNEARREAVDFNFVFGVVALLYVAALFAASAFAGMSALLLAVLSTGAVVLRMPMWMYFSVMVKSDRVAPMFLYGTMAVFFVLQEIGRLVAFGIIRLTGAEAMSTSLFASAALAGVALLFGAACMATMMRGRANADGSGAGTGSAGEGESTLRALDSNRDGEMGEDGSFAAFCERYGLSEREREIALFYSLGRSAPYISTACRISESTVKSHLRHIYAKVGVGGKQDFLDAVAREVHAPHP